MNFKVVSSLKDQISWIQPFQATDDFAQEPCAIFRWVPINGLNTSMAAVTQRCKQQHQHREVVLLILSYSSIDFSSPLSSLASSFSLEESWLLVSIK